MLDAPGWLDAQTQMAAESGYPSAGTRQELRLMNKVQEGVWRRGRKQRFEQVKDAPLASVLRKHMGHIPLS